MLDEIKSVARRYRDGKITSGEMSYGIAFILSSGALTEGEAKELSALLIRSLGAPE